MKRVIEIAILGIFLWSATGWAQEPMGGSRNTPPTRSGPEVPALESLTASVTGELLQIDLERRAVQIRTKPKGTLLGLAIDPKCDIKGDKKQFGKKELKLEELLPGYPVELVVRRADMHIIEMKVKKPKDEPGSEKPAKSGDQR